jgi:uncharacterized protein (DUF1697 family)
MSDGSLPARKDVKAALRAAGLSNRQVKGLLASGWRGLVTESEAEASELRDRLDELSSLLHANGR